MNLTKNQQAALAGAFTKGGAWYAKRGSSAGGAYYRMCRRLADMGLLTEHGPYEITPKGLSALRDIRSRKWGKHGSMATLADLEAVDAALRALKESA